MRKLQCFVVAGTSPAEAVSDAPAMMWQSGSPEAVPIVGGRRP